MKRITFTDADEADRCVRVLRQFGVSYLSYSAVEDDPFAGPLDVIVVEVPSDAA